MTCFWMPGTNSLALGFRLLLTCGEEEDVSVLIGDACRRVVGSLLTHHHIKVCVGVHVQDPQADLVLQRRQVSGRDEPLPLLLFLQQLQDAALDELLLPQLFLHLRTGRM